MDRRSSYYKQVQLLVQILPFIAKQPCFALKGGTAINLFVRELPRVSVDIDLVFLPKISRDEALAEIRRSLDAIAAELSSLKGVEVTRAYQFKQDSLRLIVNRSDVRVKVELSPILRGTVYAPQMMKLCAAAEAEFGEVEMSVVALEDLYAGKICAALDRQHPRDLFDVKWLLDTEGLTDGIRKAFLVYLSSHNRPMSELLRPQFKDLSEIYAGEFANMTEENVPLSELEAVRESLVERIHDTLTSADKAFLVSFKKCAPDWSLLELEGVDQLPALRWKQVNLARMPARKHQMALEKLKQVLGM